MKRSKILSVALLFTLCFQPFAFAGPTVSGVFKEYIPSERVLLLEQESGKVRRVKLTDSAKVEWMGRSSSLSELVQGSKIAVRVLGSPVAKELKSDLVVDWGSSNKYVKKKAHSPYYTKRGGFATSGSVAGVDNGLPGMTRPPKSTLNAIAQGGSFPENGAQPPGSKKPQKPSRVNPGTPSFQPGAPQYQPGAPQYQPGAPAPGVNPYHYDLNNPVGPSTQPLYSDGSDGSGLDMFSYQNHSSSQAVRAMVVDVDPQMRSVLVQSMSSPEPFRVELTAQSQVDSYALRTGVMVELELEQTVQGYRAHSVRAIEQ